MIPITLATEPDNFDTKVRAPGSAFLKRSPHPTAKEWGKNDHWRKAHDDLCAAYANICSYCASWTMRGSNASLHPTSSVDHFVPKSVNPSLAYEWSNYRFCRSRLNHHKGNHQDVLDPFALVPGWFKLNFLTFKIMPGDMLALPERAVERDQVKATIDRLQLNADQDYVNERMGVIREYCLVGKSIMTQISKLYPFIASEMLSQNFDVNFLPRMTQFFVSKSITR